MSDKKRLTCCEKAYIRGLRDGGMKTAEIARKLKKLPQTIYAVLRRADKPPSKKPKNPVGGQPKLSDRDVRGYIRYARKNRHATLTDIQNSGTKKVSKCTVRRALHKAGYHSRIVKQKPYLRIEHVRSRRAFVREYKNWSLEQWKKVIWTDEASFELGKTSASIRVWRTCDEAYQQECLAPTFRTTRTSVMVWGAISWGKKSQLIMLAKDKRTSADFVEQVYDGYLEEFLEEFEDPVLMEDRAPIHRAVVATNWREKHDVDSLIWPPQSPDMNPIENLWKIMKDKVQNRFYPGMKLPAFKEAIIDSWESIDVDQINDLISTMPDRIDELEEKHGGSTHY